MNLTTLIVIISLVGLALFVYLFALIIKAHQSTNLKTHRSRQEGLADLLQYAAVVADGVILNKNGSLTACWEYTAVDLASSTAELKDYTSSRLNDILKSFGSGWMIHADVTRQQVSQYPPENISFFPDQISKALDEERRAFFEKGHQVYVSTYTISLTYYPPYLAERKVTDMMYEDSVTKKGKNQTYDIIDNFQKKCLEIDASLSSIFKAKRLNAKKILCEDGTKKTHDKQLEWLQYCVTGLRHPIQLPDDPIYIDNIIGGQELYFGTIPKIGNKYIQTVAIDGFPLESDNDILSALLDLPISYRWSNRFILLDPYEAETLLEKYRKKWRQKIRGLWSQIFNTNSTQYNQDALFMSEDAAAAKTSVASGMVAFGYYTSVLVLMNEDRKYLEELSLYAATQLRTMGFGARVETINTMEAYLGSLPGHGYENIRRPIVNTMNLAHFLPKSSIWTGNEYNPCPMYPPLSPAVMQCLTNGASPYRLNIHVGDRGHTLVFGPTGSGKSTLLAMLAMQLRRYKNMRIYSFDYKKALYPTTLAVGGDHYDIGADDMPLSFCPLQKIEGKQDRTWAGEWIDNLLYLNGVKTTPRQRNEISSALTSMFESNSKTLTEFIITVQDENIREALKSYTVDGQLGYLLDAEKDNLDLSAFTTFEMEQLMEMGEKYALPILLYIFHRIEKELDGTPTVIMLDEAWVMLGHDVFREKIREWLKVLRSKNCAVIMATQSLSDAARSGILDVLAESTPTKIFLSNPYAQTDEQAALYRKMNLNKKQISIITQLIAKREYYCVSEEGSRVFNMALGPLALAFVGSTDKESLADIEKLYKIHGKESWQKNWLLEKGLHPENYGIK